MSSPPSCKVTVVGAGNVGMIAAQKCAEAELAAEIVLIDVVAGRARGIALDLNQAAAIAGHSARVLGTDDPAATRGSDVVIVTAGLPRKPGMSRSDLLGTNGKIVAAVADYVRDGSPDAVAIVVTNPLDPMTQLMRQRTGFPGRRVIGMAGLLDSARFSFFLAEAAGGSTRDAQAMVLGAHGDEMVPLPSASTLSGVPIAGLMDAAKIAALVERTRKGGGEIVQLLGTGSAFFAPGAAAAAMAAAVLRGERRLVPCACWLNGEYGFEGIYMGVPAILGRGGVERIVELPLDLEARAGLQKTAGAIQKDLDALRGLGLM